MQTVPVPEQVCNVVLLTLCRQIQSLYKHVTMCCYRNAYSSSPYKKKIFAFTVLETVPFPVQTCNHALLPNCTHFQSLHKHERCTVTVLQTVKVPVQTSNVVLLSYCRQVQSL